jgi:hypothetical protein
MDNYNNQTIERGKNMKVENQIAIHIQMWYSKNNKNHYKESCPFQPMHL